MTEELQKCISGRTEEGFLAGEPARGLGASRRPSGDVRFTGSPARYGARTFGRCFASTRHHRKNIAVQSHTKVSTLNQDLTSDWSHLLVPKIGKGGGFLTEHR